MLSGSSEFFVVMSDNGASFVSRLMQLMNNVKYYVSLTALVRLVLVSIEIDLPTSKSDIPSNEHMRRRPLFFVL